MGRTLVGYLRAAEPETLVFGESIKLKGHWVPIEGPATTAFQQALEQSGRLLVTVDDNAADNSAVFSLGMDDEAWVVRVFKGREQS